MPTGLLQELGPGSQKFVQGVTATKNIFKKILDDFLVELKVPRYNIKV